MFKKACISEFEIEYQIDGCTSVDSADMQASIRRLRKHRINGCISVELTIVQALNLVDDLQALNDSWTSVESTLVQLPNRRLY